MKLGIKPDAMIGHSIGEYVAACLAGVFSLEDALGLVVLRGRLMQKMPGGTMLSVPLPEEELTHLLKMNQDISLAAVNGPSRCVVSGSFEAIDVFKKRLKEKGYEWTQLHTSHAFHSKMMQPILPEFEEKVKQIALNNPKLPYLANLTGNWVKEEEAADPRYWSRHLKETVRFSDGIKKLQDKRNPVFIEVGPGNALTTLVRDIQAKETGGLIINVVRHPRKEAADDFYFLDKIGQLWLRGIKIDWNAFYTGEQRQRISLPTYPFERKKYRIEGDPYKIAANKLSGTSLVKKSDMGDWFYVPLWEQSLLHSQPSVEKPEPLNWLVFIDETGLGTRLVKRLQQMGQIITTVRVGEEFMRRENDGWHSFMMNPHQGDAYDQLFQELQRMDRVPDKILHLWNVDRNNNNDHHPNLEKLDESQNLGLYSLLNIVQTAGRQTTSNKIQVSVLTSNMQQVTGDEIIRPEKSTILGAVKIIPLEYININCRSIDIVLPEPGNPIEEKLDDLLLKEVMTDSADKVIAFRGLNRWVPTWKPHHLRPAEEMAQRFRNEGVYLIIGGFGGMGFTIAQYLAKTFKARLILVGRSAFPSRDQWKEWLDFHEAEDPVSLKIRKIQVLEKQGAEIMVANVDVSDYQQMGEVITRVKERFGPIHGVLHAAGVIDYGGVIQKRTRETMESALASKVRGTLVIDSLLHHEKLDFLALFSSIGNVLYKSKVGEVGYAAGNEFLESFANYKASVRGNCAFIVAINWTDWLEVGMSVESAKRQHEGDIEDIDYEAHFLDAITPAEGVEVFRKIMANQCHRLTVATKDLNLMIQHVFRSKSQESPSPGVNVEEIDEILPGRDLDPRPELSTRYVAPGNKVEQKLANLFQQYFGIEKVGIHDDFFELGGDSLKALTVAARIHRLSSVEITLPVFFSNPTIAGFADYIKKAKKSDFFTVTPAEKKEYHPLSSAQTRFYILQQIETTSTIYNMPKFMTFDKSLEKDKLEDAFRALIQRHESLRTSFTVRDGIPVQVIHGEFRFEMEFYDLKAANHSLKADVKTLIENFVRPFDLSRHPLLRARLIRTKEDRHFLLVDMHHMISDKFSLIVLEKDYQSLYSQEHLAPLKLQYKDYAEWQNHEQQISRIKQQEDYWRKEFSGEIPVLNLPTDYPRPDTQSFEGYTINFRVGSEETKALQKIASEQEATLFMVFLALECVWLSKLSGQEDIVIGAPLVGRNHPDLEKMIGLFLKTLALRNFPNSWKTFKGFLAEVRDRTLKAFENQDYSFEDLVDNLDMQRDISRNPLFDALINFYNFEEKALPADGSETKASDSDLNQILAKYGSDIAHNDLVLYVEQNGEDLFLSLEYCTKLFKQETIERFIKYFHEITSSVIENENIKLKDIHFSHELIKSESEIQQEDLEDFGI
jgi:malonyl CoA-acyl carrier protein transacylase